MFSGSCISKSVEYSRLVTWKNPIVTPRIPCARCLPVIRHCCHVFCLRVAFYHVIMCISFCIRVHLMHPSIFPIVRFAIRRSYVLWRPPFVSRCVRVLNFLGMARGLPSGLGTPVGERGRNSKFSYVSPRSIYGETSNEGRRVHLHTLVDR